jgi:lysyl-tRNA synthetase class 2
MSQYNKLEQNRLDKLEALREKGVDAFPHRVNRTHTSLEAIAAFEATEGQDDQNEDGSAELIQASLVGRMRSLRTMGKIAFAHIEDGHGRIQLFFRLNDVGAEPLKDLENYYDLGDFIEASGQMMRTRTGEATLRVESFRMLSKAITPLPAAKDEIVDGEVVSHAGLNDPETRYRQRYADLAVNPHVREIFKTRGTVIRTLRNFLDDNDFLEVETPILQPIYGGAAAQPFITSHNQLKQELYLRVSFELYLKRLLVGGIERVYEIGRDFRNEGVDRTHNPEFTMLEFYWAYADYHDVMGLTEKMVRDVVQAVHGTTTLTYQGQTIDFGQPWTRMDLREAVAELSGIDLEAYPTLESLSAAMRARDIPVRPGVPRGKLIEGLLGDFVEPTLIQPTYIVDYPRDVSPLAKSQADDPGTVERFEAFVAGFELCNAFTELNDPLDQEARFLEMGRAFAADDEDRHPLDEDYLRAMRYGMPPNGGFGMGVDRLVMLLTDSANIREVLLFPHLREEE